MPDPVPNDEPKLDTILDADWVPLHVMVADTCLGIYARWWELDNDVVRVVLCHVGAWDVGN